jgi:hypothetical protein
MSTGISTLRPPDVCVPDAPGIECTLPSGILRDCQGRFSGIPAIRTEKEKCSQILQQFGGQTPFGRPGQPAELASIYVQLAANDGSFANGQIYGSSGGSGQP